jgi:hypothetical protein
MGMKFKSLREKCTARAFRLNINRANGKSHAEEISLDYTVEPKRKLSKWDGAEVEWFRPTITQWPHGYVNTLEVDLRE